MCVYLRCCHQTPHSRAESDQELPDGFPVLSHDDLQGGHVVLEVDPGDSVGLGVVVDGSGLKVRGWLDYKKPGIN